MDNKDNKPLTATTVRELGIEFSGFRDLVSQQFKTVNKNIEELIIALNKANDSKADIKDLDNLRVVVNEKADKKDVMMNAANIELLKKMNGLKSTLLWVGLVASAIINIVFIYNLFTGKI